MDERGSFSSLRHRPCRRHSYIRDTQVVALIVYITDTGRLEVAVVVTLVKVIVVTIEASFMAATKRATTS